MSRIALIGAGFVGLGIALEWAQRGHRRNDELTVFDSGLSGATAASAGMLRVYHPRQPELSRLAIESTARFRGDSPFARLPTLRRVGCRYFVPRELAEEVRAELRALDIPYQELERENDLEIREPEAMLLDPVPAADYLKAIAKQNGVSFRGLADKSVADFDAIVVAAGAHSASLCRELFALDLPLTIKPIQLTRLHAGASAEECLLDLRHISFARPAGSGELSAGHPWTESSPAERAEETRRRLAHRYPEARVVAEGSPVSECYTASGLPLVERVEKNIFVAAGFSGSGIKLTPWAAARVCDLLEQNDYL